MKTREELLNTIPKNTIGAEIGVFEGNFSIQIQDIINPQKLYLVDLFEGEMCSGDKNGNNIKYIDLSDSYEILNNKFINDKKKKYGVEIKPYKGYRKDLGILILLQNYYNHFIKKSTFIFD